MANILIVDDDNLILQQLTIYIKTSGNNPLSTLYPTSVIEYLGIEHIDLILLDINMPKLDGVTLLKELKSHPDYNSIPVIMLTGDKEMQLQKACFNAGAMDFIYKPVSEIVLYARIHSALSINDYINRLESEITVRKRTEDRLKHSKKELKKTNIDKDTFFTIISHDLRSPFNSLMGICQMLDEEFDELDREEIKELISTLRKSTNSVYELLDGLLDWSRANTGRMDYEPKEIDLYEISMNVKVLLQETSNNKNIKLVNNIKENSKVFADANMLSTIFRNLIINAIKFTPIGGSITIFAKRKGGKFLTTISDNGIGISENDRKKLFRIDVHHTTYGTNKEIGTGLGLILCKELVKKNNGKIWVESELGKGSKFTFSLPIEISKNK
ncbi:MAG: hybrid sensor histidine kinase/response regulator [Melioribacteraceae bacterium]|nr:hybrid sensor histidine kinase/response regulator [Melioribacteraceae bacterium]